MKTLIALLTTVLLLLKPAFAENSIAPSLLNIANEHLSQSFSEENIVQGLKSGLWNEAKTAIAATFLDENKTGIYMFIKVSEEKYLVADISQVEGANLGKLGIAQRAEYTKIETFPTEWLSRDDGLYQVVIRTRAWKGSQRYTVYEPQIVELDGIPIWR